MREVFHEIVRTRDIGHSTVLKLMQIMTEKGTVLKLVRNIDRRASHIGSALYVGAILSP